MILKYVKVYGPDAMPAINAAAFNMVNEINCPSSFALSSLCLLIALFRYFFVPDFSRGHGQQ